MSNSYKITLDKTQINVMDSCHYLEAASLVIEYDIHFEYRTWGIKDISVVINHIYGDITLEVEDEACNLFLEDPIFKEITINTKLKGGKFPIWNMETEWITHDTDERSISPTYCEIYLKENKIEVWI